MEALTSPEDYRQFDTARSIEFYTNPARIPGPAVLSPTSDWGELSRASSAGPREPMERVVTCIEWHSTEHVGLPDIRLNFTYAGDAAVALFYDCLWAGEGIEGAPVHLWRFRVTGQDGGVTERCFRAVLPKSSIRRREGHPGMLFGTFTALDAQPFVEEV